MGTSNMELMDQQAASQTKMSRREENFSLPQYFAVSEKKKWKDMLVTLRGNSAKSKEKSVFITAWSCKLSPWCCPLCSALSSRPTAAAAANRSDTIIFMLEFPRRWQLSHGLLHMPVLGTHWAESRTWNLGPTRSLLPFRGCSDHFSCSREQGTHLHLQPRAEQSRWRGVPYSLLPYVSE